MNVFPALKLTADRHLMYIKSSIVKPRLLVTSFLRTSMVGSPYCVRVAMEDKVQGMQDYIKAKSV